jgi:acetylxylan esterase
MVKGISAVASAVNAFHTQCPDTKLVLVGYSQGGQIMDNAFCGGPDDSNGYSDSAPAIDSSAMGAISAVIEMGSPRFVGGLAYGVGTCTAGGFSARPSGYTCSVSFHQAIDSSIKHHSQHLPNLTTHEELTLITTLSQSAAKMQSYCDSSDPYCCNGSDGATHQGYGTEYGQDALTFIKSKLDSASSASSGATASQDGTAQNGTAASTGADAEGSGSSASVPITNGGQSTGAGTGTTGAAAGQSSGTDATAAAGAQTGGNSWGQSQSGSSQWGGWGGWGRKN